MHVTLTGIDWRYDATQQLWVSWQQLPDGRWLFSAWEPADADGRTHAVVATIEGQLWGFVGSRRAALPADTVLDIHRAIVRQWHEAATGTYRENGTVIVEADSFA